MDLEHHKEAFGHWSDDDDSEDESDEDSDNDLDYFYGKNNSMLYWTSHFNGLINFDWLIETSF